jgi:hypothetical protein
MQIAWAFGGVSCIEWKPALAGFFAWVCLMQQLTNGNLAASCPINF